MRFIHIADVHLGAVPDENKPWSVRRKQELWDAFAEVVETAGREKVDFLLIAGDLFHRQPLLRELKEVNYLFGRIPKVKVVLIAGNHDYIHPNSYYRTFQWERNVFFLGKQEIGTLDFPEENVCIYGASYWQREMREPIYDKIEPLDENRINVLLAHGGDAKHIPFSPKRLVEHGFDYAACGHIHQPGMLVEQRAIMAGALQPIDQNDAGAHGYWQGEVNKRGCTVKFYPIRKCEYVHLTVAVGPEMTNGELQDKVAEILSYAEPFQIYKFKISGRKNPETEFDLNRIAEMEHVVSVESDFVLDYDFEKLKEEYGNQMLGRFIRAMERNRDNPASQKALYYGVDALCKTMRRP